ncbi:MAG: endonuclease III [Chitinophagales bacterium]|nr:endonuclease III [Chitinophagales bacterium]
MTHYQILANFANMTLKERFAQSLAWLGQHYHNAETELVYTNPYELLVAVILSAQCTDKRVNMVTPALFERFPTPFALATATFDEVFPYIRSISFPNNKTKHLLGMAKILAEQYQGEVPADVALLQKLPGVGRKTAHVITSVIFRQPNMAVDTHVLRVSNRIGLSTAKARQNPLLTEQQLIKHIPQQDIPDAHHWLILHGRYICVARKPKCPECGLRDCCKYYQQQAKKALILD